MSIISVGKYPDISSLSQSIDNLYTGLKKGHIVAALPDGNITIRVATIWERFRSWIRFKPQAIRLENVQPLLSSFFKNNEMLLASYSNLHEKLDDNAPDLYAKLLSIYLHSVCKREETLPLFFTEKSPVHQPITIDPQDERVINFTIDNSETKTNDQDESAIVATKTISAPYALFEKLDNFPFAANTTIIFDDYFENTFKSLIKYLQSGELDINANISELIDLAQLAIGLKQNNLVRKIINFLISSLSTENYCERLSDLMNLIKTEEFKPYFETDDQWIVMSLLSKVRKLRNHETEDKEVNQSFSEYIVSVEKDFPDNACLQYLIGKFYEYGIGVKEDFKKAVHTYKALADKSNSWGQCALGECRHYREANYSEAFNLYNLAAKQGLLMAIYHRAVCYNSGLGVKKDLKKTSQDLQKLARQGFQMGLYGLGLFHKNGCEVKKDSLRAVKLFELADQEPRALIQLAECYEKGIVVNQNQQEAFKRWKEAALDGIMEAQYKLGRIYSGKEEFFDARSTACALHWLSKAASQEEKINKQEKKAKQDYEKLLLLSVATP